jgi:hypothetical protein
MRIIAFPASATSFDAPRRIAVLMRGENRASLVGPPNGDIHRRVWIFRRHHFELRWEGAAVSAEPLSGLRPAARNQATIDE